MKNFTLIIALVLASGYIYGQNREDQTQILQKCIQLQELQKLYPLDRDGSQKPLIIKYWHPLLFPTDLTIVYGDTNVEFVVMSEENINNIEAYFLFKKFELHEDSCKVAFEFYYNINSLPKVVEVVIDLVKMGNDWKESGIQVNNKE